MRKMGRCPLSCARMAAPDAVMARKPRREMVMMGYRAYLPLLKLRFLFGCQGTSVGADIVAHEAQGLQDGGPVFQVRGEDLLHQLARPLGKFPVAARRH